MSKLIALFTLISFTAFAQVSFPVKEGILVNDKDETVEVGKGRYLDQKALEEVWAGMDAMENQNLQLVQSLERANKKLLECTPSIPGFPTWATVLITAGLSILTSVAGFFAIREATK